MDYRKKIIKLFFKYKSIIMYIIFGLLTTIINISLYALFTKVFNMNYMLSNVISWIITILTAYITNKLYVFNSKSFEKKLIIKEFTSFIISRLGTLVIELVLLYMFVTVFKFNDMIVKFVVTFIVVLLNYIFSKLYIFKKDKN